MFIVSFIKVCFGNNMAEFEIQYLQLTKLHVQWTFTCGANVFKTQVKAEKQVDTASLTHHLDTNSPVKLGSLWKHFRCKAFEYISGKSQHFYLKHLLGYLEKDLLWTDLHFPELLWNLNLGNSQGLQLCYICRVLDCNDKEDVIVHFNLMCG